MIDLGRWQCLCCFCRVFVVGRRREGDSIGTSTLFGVHYPSDNKKENKRDNDPKNIKHTNDDCEHGAYLIPTTVAVGRLVSI